MGTSTDSQNLMIDSTPPTCHQSEEEVNISYSVPAFCTIIKSK